MLQLYVRFRSLVADGCAALLGLLVGNGLAREEGQTTAEYALVILAAAAVAVVLITWAKTSGKLPAFFDQIIDDVMGNA